jgi:hypothetical protein
MIDKVAEKLNDKWRITVTDYFGGRGHDYKGKGADVEEINDNGGIMLVITAVPDSQREWIQWKGNSTRLNCAYVHLIRNRCGWLLLLCRSYCASG